MFTLITATRAAFFLDIEMYNGSHKNLLIDFFSAF